MPSTRHWMQRFISSSASTVQTKSLRPRSWQALTSASVTVFFLRLTRAIAFRAVLRDMARRKGVVNERRIPARARTARTARTSASLKGGNDQPRKPAEGSTDTAPEPRPAPPLLISMLIAARSCTSCSTSSRPGSGSPFLSLIVRGLRKQKPARGRCSVTAVLPVCRSCITQSVPVPRSCAGRARSCPRAPASARRKASREFSSAFEESPRCAMMSGIVHSINYTGFRKIGNRRRRVTGMKNHFPRTTFSMILSLMSLIWSTRVSGGHRRQWMSGRSGCGPKQAFRGRRFLPGGRAPRKLLKSAQ